LNLALRNDDDGVDVVEEEIDFLTLLLLLDGVDRIIRSFFLACFSLLPVVTFLDSLIITLRLLVLDEDSGALALFFALSLFSLE
jgi:hypothetical protein